MADRTYTVNYDGNGGNMIRLQLHIYTTSTSIELNRTVERADLYAIVDNASYGWWNGYGSEAFIGINGNNTTQTVTFDYGTTGTKTLISSWDTLVQHDAQGKATLGISAHHYSDVGLGNASIPANTYECDTIPRYATCNQSLASKTETSITMNWTSDNTIDRVWYSTNGGTSFTLAGDVNATSGSYTITGLTANTTYSIKTRVRRKDSQLTTDSTALSVTTYKLVTQSMNSKTVNSISMKWTSGETANYLWYSKDNGTNWVAVGSVSGTSGTYNITGLTPNTAYNIKTRIRRSADSSLSVSAVSAITTYDIAKITGSANWTIGNNTSVSYTNPSGASISIGIYNTAGSVAYASYRTPTASPYTFNFTNTENTALYNSIPNSPTGKVRIYLKTTVNSANYYDYAEKTISVNESICKPIFSDFYYEDTDINVANLTGNNKILVNGLSDPTIVVWEEDKAVARNGASMSKYRVKIGNQTFEKAYSATGAEYLKVFTNITSPIIEVSAIDSRGLETKVTKTAIWKDYSKPSITKMELTRENAIGTKVFFNFEADYWNGNFGSTQNTIDNLKFRYMPKGGTYSNWINITNSIQYSNGKVTTISGSFLPTTNNGSTPIEFLVGTEYYVQFHIDDSTLYIQSVNSTQQPINSGIPCTDKYKDSNGNYHVGINQLAESDSALVIGGSVNVKSGMLSAPILKATSVQIIQTDINLNNVKDFYRIYYCNGCTNMPTSINGYLEVQKLNDNYVMQEFTTVYGNRYVRTCANGTWSGWLQLNNIAGSNSNANGSYLQFSDGTMICWYSYRVTASNSNFATAYGSIWHNGSTTWTFPVKFTGVPTIIATAYLKGGIGGFNITTEPNDTAIAGYEYSFAKYNFGAGNAGVDFMAIGRWK